MFSFIGDLYNSFVYDPLFDLLVFLYQNLAFESLGLAIIFLTVLIRLVLLPFFYKSARSQALMQKLRPKINEIRDEHEDDKEKQAQKLMELYQEHNFNPFSGFLILIIQLPIFFALFRIFRDQALMESTFSHTMFIGLNLGEASIALTFVAAILQYFQGKLTMSQNKSSGGGAMASFGKIMPYAAPFISFIILMNLPSALALYWGTSTLFSVGQQVVINKKLEEEENKRNKKKEDEKDNDKPESN